MKTLPHILLYQAEICPNALALQDGEWVLSYRELRDNVARCAGAMRAAGLHKGERFAIWAPNIAEWVVTALAGQTLGAVLVTLNTRYKGAEAADILRRSQCRFLFTVRDFLGRDFDTSLTGEVLPDLHQTVILRDGSSSAPFKQFLSRCETPVIEPDVAETDIADIIFTSGTTGAPKGAMCSHAQNIRAFEAFTAGVGMRSEDRYLVVNPFFHSFGYKAGWMSCLIVGAAIFPLAVFDPVETMQRIQRDRVTVMPGAPTIFQTLIKHPQREDFDLSSLRVATTGATTIPVDLIQQMRDVLKIDDVFSAYGLTESTGIVSLCRRGDSAETIATTCGRALEGTELRFVDDNGDDVAPGEPGEIWVRGFNVMQGYLDDLEATARTITRDGWLKTGDVGVRDGSGYLRITDRKKDMVIVGGFNCYPAEIEKTLLQHPDVEDVAVVGVPDARLGEVTHAHIVSNTPDADAILAWAKNVMANYKVPRGITFHDALPRNASGKVQKFKLQQ